MENIVELKGITKIYPNGIIANDRINFELRKGEIHALLGENGAGKSTLMKVLFGTEKAEEGDIYFKGKKVNIKNPNHAIEMGIGMVHQHFMLIDSFTIANNIILGKEPRKGIFVDYEEGAKQVEELAKKYNFKIDIRKKVEDLSVGTKQKVEILKALYRGVDVLILDEPTAVLTPKETEELFVQLKKLAKEGLSIIFISHKLDEIKEICDRITIMRNGKDMGTYDTKNLSTREMSELMIGREVVTEFKKKVIKTKPIIASLKDISVRDSMGVLRLDNIDLDIYGGEVIGIAGVEGNGQDELVDVLSGLNKKYHGEYKIFGENAREIKIKELREKGLSYIPADRMTVGCAKEMNIMSNLFSTQYENNQYTKGSFMNIKAMKEKSNELIKEYLVKARDYNDKVGGLSGGNIQKVVIARELFVDPKMIIADQPTRGIDIGASEFVREKLIEYRDKGRAVILISADLNEILQVSDKIAVIYNGKFTGIFKNEETLTKEEIGEYMLGIKNDMKGDEKVYENGN